MPLSEDPEVPPTWVGSVLKELNPRGSLGVPGLQADSGVSFLTVKRCTAVEVADCR